MRRNDRVLEKYRAEFDGRIPAFDRTMIYGQIIQCIGAEQFKWNNVPDTMNSHFIESAVNSGVAVAYYVPDNVSATCKGFTVTPCAFIGVPNQTGMTNRVITRGSDYSLEIDLEKDNAVIIKNNDYMYSEYVNMLWFAEMLARTDESEKALIIWSKMHPIAKATTGIESAKLTEILKGIIENDDLYNVISDNSKIVTGQPNSRDDSVLRLTDENAVEKMHFLSEFHYELIRRYCNLYNMPFRTTAKSAQNLESELHNTDIFSKMMNANRLECRQNAAAEMREKFGIDITVDFSELIKEENEVINANIENTVESESPDTNKAEVNDDEKTDNDNTD